MKKKEKQAAIKRNRIRYGLPEDYVDQLQLPDSRNIKFFKSINRFEPGQERHMRFIHGVMDDEKQRRSIVEKTRLLERMAQVLEKHQKAEDKGYRLINFKFKSLRAWRYAKSEGKMLMKEENHLERRGGSRDEGSTEDSTPQKYSQRPRQVTINGDKPNWQNWPRTYMQNRYRDRNGNFKWRPPNWWLRNKKRGHNVFYR